MSGNGSKGNGSQRNGSQRNGSQGLVSGIVLFVIGCTALPLGILAGVFTGLEFLFWIAGVLFTIGLVAFIIGIARRVGSSMGGSSFRMTTHFFQPRRTSRPEPRRPRTPRVSTRCPSCGAKVAPRYIEQAPEGPVVVCPYCDTVYTPEEGYLA